MTTQLLGIGTGRCGTMSLATVLSACDQVDVRHEMGGGQAVLPWSFDALAADRQFVLLSQLSGAVVGDVASYYLNYLGFFFARLDELRVIHIHRDRAQVVRSFMRKTVGRNHWQRGDPGSLPDSRWDPAYPKYGRHHSKEEAIGLYYDEYRQRADDLEALYPGRMLQIDLTVLNEQQTQQDIFDFLGIAKHNRAFTAVHANRSPVEPFEATCERFARELTLAVGPGRRLIAVDIHHLSPFFAAPRGTLPFLERNGRAFGRPKDSDAAIAELEAMRRRGAEFIVFPWTAFWWLDHYAAFRDHLRRHYPVAEVTARLMLFDLRTLGAG